MSESGFEVPNRVGERFSIPNPADIRRIQIGREMAPIEAYYGNRELPPLDFISEYHRQINAGVNCSYTGGSCGLAAAGNALRALGLFKYGKHTEEKLTEYLGGDAFLARTNGGIDQEELSKTILELTPGITVRGSISAYEILRSGENGAAVIVGTGAAHVGTLYPGHRVTRDEQGKLQVQVVDPARGIEMMPMRDFIRFQLPLLYPPNYNVATIIEKVKPNK